MIVTRVLTIVHGKVVYISAFTHDGTVCVPRCQRVLDFVVENVTRESE